MGIHSELPSMSATAHGPPSSGQGPPQSVEPVLRPPWVGLAMPDTPPRHESLSG